LRLSAERISTTVTSCAQLVDRLKNRIAISKNFFTVLKTEFFISYVQIICLKYAGLNRDS
jgi:hypothetical protein